MGSSEIVDSGRVSGQKSNFSQTCSLLTQYLKEKGSFGDLSLGLNRNFESNGVPAKTMNLLPMIEKTGPNSEAPAGNPSKSVNLFPQPVGFYSVPVKEEAQKKADISVVKSEPETAQMTIFYGGRVLVFNDFPADKAKEIMLLASKGSSLNTNAFTPNMPPKPAESASSLVTTTPNTVPSFGNGLVQENAQSPLYPRVSDLPLSRKASLGRFLEKRKDRITAKAPYPASNTVVASSKSAENKTSLGFGAQFPLQMERQCCSIGVQLWFMVCSFLARIVIRRSPLWINLHVSANESLNPVAKKEEKLSESSSRIYLVWLFVSNVASTIDIVRQANSIWNCSFTIFFLTL